MDYNSNENKIHLFLYNLFLSKYLEILRVLQSKYLAAFIQVLKDLYSVVS